MGVFAGPANAWSNFTNQNRLDASTKLVNQSGLMLNLDAGVSSSYPGSGTTWTDLSGNGRNGSLASVGYSSSNRGTLTFNGTNSRVDLTANSINSNADLTLNFWVNSPLPAINGSYTLLSGYSTAGHLQVRYFNSSSITSVQLVKSNTANMGTFSGFTALINTTYLITVILIKSTNTWYLYVNGNFISSFVSSQTFITSGPSLGTNLVGTSEFFSGNMYSFSYYNRALTATEISQNFNATRARFGI